MISNLRYEPLETSFFKENRAKFIENMPENTMAVFCSNQILSGNSDGSMGFIQNSSFYYLSGIDQEDSILIILKSKLYIDEILYIPETSEHIKIWEGEKLSPSQAQWLSGIDKIDYISNFWTSVKQLCVQFEHIWVHRDLVLLKNAQVLNFEKYIYKRLKKLLTGKTIGNCADLINKQRLIKHKVEIAAIKKAIDLSYEGLKCISKVLKTGVYEYELEAELDYYFKKNKVRRHAFEPIIASGANACILHYVNNNSICKNGEMVLIDFGAEYANYNADITRTLPVSGKFTDRQTEVYEAVHEVFNYHKNAIKPGVSLVDIRKSSKEKTAEVLINLGLISRNSYEIKPEIVNDYYPHGPSHFLGLDVHDVGDRETILTENMVITCEPGIYIKNENLGIRLENDFLITSNGIEDLCEHIPMDIKSIGNLNFN